MVSVPSLGHFFLLKLPGARCSRPFSEGQGMTLQEIKLIAESDDSTVEQMLEAMKALSTLWAVTAILDASATKH